MTEETLEGLREQIRKLDEELIERAARRIDLARQVGDLKRRHQLATVDFTQERVVLDRARESAVRIGLDPAVAEELFTQLIRASVSAQDEDSLRVSAVGAGKTAVVVGGAGRMGRWMRRFLSTQGYTTGALDPAATVEEGEWAREVLPSADLILCSSPPAAIADLYRSWRDRPPRGVIVDIASIKTPLIEPIRQLQRAGARVASVHPMFGPSVVLLRDVDVVICDTGDDGATALVEKLFLPTTAHLVRVPLDAHDQIMADLLSLAHAAAIAFALALPETEHPVRSTTFQALESLAGAVVRESPDVYFEIQARNPHSPAALERFRGAIDRIVTAATAGDARGFRALFEEAQRRTPQ